MEHSLSSLSFKGSILEAITQAKQQKKLFVVYISGDNPESNRIETSTWTDSRVAESITKYCLLLHITEGSSDAINFSAIYPQKPSPCIAAIGYNGVQVFQSEGFVAADFLASSLEKAWLSLQIQETAATFLTASLASSKERVSGTSNSPSLEQASSSTTNVQSPPISREASPPGNSEIKKKDEYKHDIEETNPKTEPHSSSGSLCTESTTETAKLSSDSVVVDPSEGEFANKNESGYHVPANSMDFQELAAEAKEATQICGVGVEVEKADVSPQTISNDVHLNIRLPSGSSLQVTFSKMDTLAMVKDYVKNKQTSGFGSFDLAIPYPRKVFDEKDMNQQLCELGLSNRQALMVVLRNQTTSHPRGGSSSRDQSNANDRDVSARGSNEGYWAFVKRMASYINPLSYLGGSPSSSDTEQDTQSGVWQYAPNPSLQNDLRGTGRAPYTVYSPNHDTPAASSSSNSRSRQPNPSRFGSNIHTLKHDEDDSQFSGRNAFWNGNSTQFGGDNDGK